MGDAGARRRPYSGPCAPVMMVGAHPSRYRSGEPQGWLCLRCDEVGPVMAHRAATDAAFEHSRLCPPRACPDGAVACSTCGRWHEDIEALYGSVRPVRPSGLAKAG